MSLKLSILALLLAPSGGCGGANTAPHAPPVLRYADPTALLASHRATIDSLFGATLALVQRALPVTDVLVTISPDRSRAIGGYGLGGRTPNAATVDLFVDMTFPGIDSLLPQRLPGLLAHELHHAMRWRRPGYGSSLLEAMISEGMADRFAHELLGTPLPPWSEAFPRADTERFLALARAEFDSRSYNHARWFFDADPQLPRWTAYTLGYRLVEAYQQAHPGSSAAQLVTMPAQAFRP